MEWFSLTVAKHLALPISPALVIIQITYVPVVRTMITKTVPGTKTSLLVHEDSSHRIPPIL